MNRETYEAKFDRVRRRRLESLVTLGDPAWTADLDSERVRARLGRVEVLITGWGAERITGRHLSLMPRLRGLFHCAGTVRPIISDGFWERGIVVSNAADANAVPVAEFTLAAVIMAGKKVPFLANDVRATWGDWAYISRFGELSNLGRTVGVVGLSRIGRRVVTLLQQLEDITVLVADPYADPAETAALGGQIRNLEEMLPALDVLSLHAPALPSTRHMIGAAQLALLPDHATVINTARGSLIDTQALERECASGRLNAILDVIEPEPLQADSVLYRLPNVMLTPHVAGSLGSELYRMTDSALDEVERFITGRPLVSQITSETFKVSA
ncbi:hydroxyacid dehydrogenase [Enemella evansiae]|uniref:Hydroxyacid dehydrogenase n=2 Tax=Enemella evansiae TaxID=2016499 RepID=A0A255G978_9ACTN|nr:hydroxyacid dehydrogenase [Enemella evansiae]OYO06523.1 hydroxyacid dehydrogenase [Enemella evansiae]OYO10793.1 hydroxyacid dehydrogenase [Enemella evansiae]OYO15781.1 hydroxyacid dehydrogenase [Enemella evansiae]